MLLCPPQIRGKIYLIITIFTNLILECVYEANMSDNWLTGSFKPENIIWHDAVIILSF